MLESIASALKEFAAAVSPAMSTIVRDLAALGGVAAIVAGTWQIYVPAGFIVLGGMLLAGALLTAKR